MNTRPIFRRATRALAALSFVGALALPAGAQLSKPVAMLKGEVRSELDQNVIAGLPVSIMHGTEKIMSSKTNVDGKFTAVVPPGNQYRVIYSSPDFSYREDTIVVPTTDKYQEIAVRSTVMPLYDNQDLTPKQAVFAKGSSTIDPVVAVRLDQLASLVKKNPRFRLELAVYPDIEIRSKKDAAQQKLLNERSVALRSFFIGRNASSVTIEALPTLSGATSPEPVTVKAKKGKKSAAVPSSPIAQSVKITGRLS
jgi:hypothetical protein